MIEIECSIKEIFDAIEDIKFESAGEKIKFNGDENFEIKLKSGDISVQDENNNWIKVRSLITKIDDILVLRFDDGCELKVGKKHRIRFEDDKCRFAKHFRVGDYLYNSLNKKLTVTEIIDLEEGDIVYDMYVLSESHLYQTANNIVHHNTVAAKTAAKVLDRPFFMFRVGAMQDPRSSLIGNTFYNKEKGTYFRASRFITAIQTPNAVILLDELSRAHPEAHNILLSVLDPEQKCISLDENDAENGEDTIIKVAEGVSFVATANMGNEYTGTRQIDRANIDRFQYIEIDLLDEKEELALAKLKFPDCDPALLGFLCKISANIKEQYLLDNVTNMMSTRMVLEAAELLDDGFTIGEALEATIVPLFTKEGGASSERTYLNSIIDKHVPKNKANDKSAKAKIIPIKTISLNNPFNAAKK